MLRLNILTNFPLQPTTPIHNPNSKSKEKHHILGPDSLQLNNFEVNKKISIFPPTKRNPKLTRCKSDDIELFEI
jgi:hypothetical protein